MPKHERRGRPKARLLPSGGSAAAQAASGGHTTEQSRTTHADPITRAGAGTLAKPRFAAPPRSRCTSHIRVVRIATAISIRTRREASSGGDKLDALWRSRVALPSIWSRRIVSGHCVGRRVSFGAGIDGCCRHRARVRYRRMTSQLEASRYLRARKVCRVKRRVNRLSVASELDRSILSVSRVTRTLGRAPCGAHGDFRLRHCDLMYALSAATMGKRSRSCRPESIRAPHLSFYH